MNKKLIYISLLFLLSISIVSSSVNSQSTIIGTYNGDKIVDVNSDSIPWNEGFRDDSDIATCYAYHEDMDAKTIMKCYGFKEVN